MVSHGSGSSVCNSKNRCLCTRTNHNCDETLELGCLKRDFTVSRDNIPHDNSVQLILDFLCTRECRFHFCFFVCFLPSYNLFFLCIWVICVKLYPEYEIKMMMTCGMTKCLETHVTNAYAFGSRHLLKPILRLRRLLWVLGRIYYKLETDIL